MSIAMERFAATGLFPTLQPVSMMPRVAMYVVQCRSCGFEPEGTDRNPKVCPKCSGRSWERVTRPGSLLADAERF